MTIIKKGTAYFKSGKSWKVAEKGDIVIGYLIHRSPIELKEMTKSY